MDGATKDRQGGPPGPVRVILKNPTRVQQEGFTLEVSKATTLKELKKEISMRYPGRPESSDVTLVYAGKLLRDDSMDIESMAGTGGDFGTVTMHIVVRETKKRQQGASIGAVDRQIMDRSRIKKERTIETGNREAYCPEEMSLVEVETETEEVGSKDARQSGSGLNSDVVENYQAEHTHASLCMPDVSSFRTQDYLYVPVFHAAYQAAVQTFLSYNQVKKAGASATGRQSANNKNKISNDKNSSTLAFLPTVIPLPQPPFPPAIPKQSWQEDTEAQYASRLHKEQDTQQKKPIFVPVVSLPISSRPEEYETSNISKNGLRRRRNYGQDQAETTEHVLRLLRELRGQQEQRDLRETENMNIQPNGQARNNARRRQVQIRIHINMRVLLQVAVLLLIVYQHCPPGRFFALLLIGFTFYLSSTRIGKIIVNKVLERFHVNGIENRPRADGEDNNNINLNDDGHIRPGPVAPAAREQNGPNNPHPLPGAGLLQEMQAFIAGFITSLLPAADNRALQDNNNMEMQQQGIQRDIFGGNNGNA